MADKGKKWQEAQEMREAGHEEAAAIHLIEDLIDEDDGSVFEDMEDDTPEDAEEIADEDEGEDDAFDDESEDVEDVEEVDEDDESEPSDEADEDEPQTFKVPAENGEGFEEITRDEYESRQLRMADYTRKTQALAEQRKAVEAEVEARRAERQKYADGLERLESAMAAIVPEELSVEEIKAMSPEQIEAHKAARKNLEQIQTERERVQQEAAEETETLMLQKQVERDEFLTATIPGWSDLDKARSEMAELVSYAQENYGYSLEDISRTVDPQAFVLLRKAKLYDEMTEKGEKVRKKAKKSITLKPGSPAPKGSKSKKKKEAALSRHGKQGTLRSAAQALEGLLD